MRILVYIVSYITFFTGVTGNLFRIQHWPGGAFMTFLSMILLPFAFGLLLIHKYRSRSKKDILQQGEPNDVLDLNL